MSRARLRAATLALALAVTAPLLAGCSGGDDASSEAGQTVSGSTNALAYPAADAAAAAAAPAAVYGSPKAARASKAAPSPTKSNKAGSGSKLSVPEAALDGRVIAYTAEQTIQVADVGKAVTQIEAAVDAAGGLIARSERSGGTPAGPGEPTPPASADLRLRIPPGAFESFLARIEKTGVVLERTTSGDDVTDEVVDVGSRLASARKSLDRVRLLMERATTLRDVVSLESEVASREAELEALLARQAKLKQRTDLASVTVHLVTKELAITPLIDKKEQGFGAGLGDGWDAFKTSATALATVLGAVLPFALALLVLSPFLLVAHRRYQRTAQHGISRTADTV